MSAPSNRCGLRTIRAPKNRCIVELVARFFAEGRPRRTALTLHLPIAPASVCFVARIFTNPALFGQNDRIVTGRGRTSKVGIASAGKTKAEGCRLKSKSLRLLRPFAANGICVQPHPANPVYPVEKGIRANACPASI
jgi:hypothetical protein